MRWVHKQSIAFLVAVLIPLSIGIGLLANPLDEDLIFASSKKHGRVLIVTEEQQNNSFTEALSHRIYHHCFQFLDAPIEVFGSLNLPAVPINLSSESAMLPNVEKVKNRIEQLLQY